MKASSFAPAVAVLKVKPVVAADDIFVEELSVLPNKSRLVEVMMSTSGPEEPPLPDGGFALTAATVATETTLAATLLAAELTAGKELGDCGEIRKLLKPGRFDCLNVSG